MKLEDQVVSLELSKKLKELGAKQDGAFAWWQQEKDFGKHFLQEGSTTQISDSTKGKTRRVCSAFTVAELGELLPRWLDFYHTPESWVVRITDFGPAEHNWEVLERTEADARAQMLIYLIENKLLTI